MSLTKSITQTFLGALNKPLGGASGNQAGLSFLNGGVPLVLDGAYSNVALGPSGAWSGAFWVRKPFDGVRTFFDSGQTTNVNRFTDVDSAGGNLINFNINDALGGNSTVAGAPGSFPNSANWQCVFIFGKTGTATRIFVGDAEIGYNIQNFNGPMDYTGFNTVSIGAPNANKGSRPGADWPSDIADVWVSYSAYVDFSILANRRQFLQANGKAVTLNAVGSITNFTGAPVTVQPHFYFSLRQNDALSTYLNNRGSVILTGGKLSITSGTLAASATNPS